MVCINIISSVRYFISIIILCERNQIKAPAKIIGRLTTTRGK